VIKTQLCNFDNYNNQKYVSYEAQGLEHQKIKNLMKEIKIIKSKKETNPIE
jgi:hypothetical protein